jgi:hypothetical protein
MIILSNEDKAMRTFKTRNHAMLNSIPLDDALADARRADRKTLVKRRLRLIEVLIPGIGPGIERQLTHMDDREVGVPEERVTLCELKAILVNGITTHNARGAEGAVAPLALWKAQIRTR